MTTFSLSEFVPGDIETGTVTASQFFITHRSDPNLRLVVNAVTTFDLLNGEPVSGAIGSVGIVDQTGRVGLLVEDNLPDLSALLASQLPLQDIRDDVSWEAVIDPDAEPEIFNNLVIVVPNTDGTKTRFEGQFQLFEDGAPTGLLTAIRHLTAGGAEIVADTVLYAPPIDFTLAVAALFPGSPADWDILASTLFAGANTITAGPALLASDGYQIEGFGGDDTFVDLGAAGARGVSYAFADAGVVVDLDAEAATGGAGSDTFPGVDFNNAYGSRYNDVLRGGSGADFLAGNSGDDTLVGRAGGDTIHGDEGNDTLDYSGDALAGGNGAISVTLTAALTGTARDGFGNVDNLSSIENVVGTNQVTIGFGDIMIGNQLVNTFSGLGAADYIDGAGGDDVIYGGDGGDALVGGVGNDTVEGDDGNDVILLDDYTNAFAGGGNDTAFGDAGNDLLWGYAGNDGLYGGAGNDALVGNDFGTTVGGTDAMYGGSGDDTFFVGLAGNAQMDGGDDDDSFFGAGGNDIIVGGAGSDYAYGAGGADVFVLRAADLQAGDVDIIYFFSRAEGDLVQLDAALAGQISLANILLPVDGIGNVASVYATHASGWSAVFYGTTVVDVEAATYFV